MGAVQQDRYPARYNMRSKESREIVELGKANGGLTLVEIRGLARSKKIAAKSIHQTLEQSGVPILTEEQRAAMPKPKKKRTPKKPTAESVFSDPRFSKEPEPETPSLEVIENPKPKTVDENRADADYAALTEALAEVEEMRDQAIAEAKALREEADQLVAKARKQMEITAKLRRETAEDREKLGEAQHRIRLLEGKLAQLADVEAIKDERDNLRLLRRIEAEIAKRQKAEWNRRYQERKAAKG